MHAGNLAIRHSRVVLAILAVLMVYGVFSYFELPAREDPEITIREAVVTVSHPHQSPRRMELLVAKRIEEALREMPEIEEIRSTSLSDMTIVRTKVYDRYTELDPIWHDLRHRVRAISADLTPVAGTPRVDTDFGDVAVLTAALVAEDASPGQKHHLARHIRDQLYEISGTRRVELHGARDERIYLEARQGRIKNFGLTPGDVATALSEQNIIKAGGVVDTGQRRHVVRPGGEHRTVDQIGETLIRLPDHDGGNSSHPPQVLRLDEIARISRRAVDPPERLAYFNGKPAVVLAISMEPQYNALEYGPRLKKRLKEIESSLPVGFRIKPITFQPREVARAVYGTTASVLQALIVVMAVVMVFLGLRLGLLVAVIVPSVMLITLAIMNFAGITLDRISLATLIISLGLLVDNAIVVAEDIKTRIESGTDRLQAIRESGSHLGLPLLACTATTILFFLPLMLAEHVAGEYTRAISQVILISLTASWILAMTAIPMLGHRYIPAPSARQDPRSVKTLGNQIHIILTDAYERLIRSVLRFRIPFLGTMAILLIAAVLALGQASQRFFPESDRAQVLIDLELPADVTTRSTRAAAEAIFEVLGDDERFPQIASFAGYVGFGGPRFVLQLPPADPAPNRAFVLVNLHEASLVADSVKHLRAMFVQDFPGLQARVSSMYLGPADSTKLDVMVRGPDANHVYQAASRVQSAMAEIPGVIDIHQNWDNLMISLDLDIDQAMARQVGVTSRDVANSLQASLQGLHVTDFREGDREIPVIWRSPDHERERLEYLEALTIRTPGTAERATIDTLGSLQPYLEFSRIERYNMARAVTVQAANSEMTAEDMMPRLQAAFNKISAGLEPGHEIRYDGVVRIADDARRALAANLPLCAGLAILLLIALFNSFRRALVVVLTLPLIIIGASLGIYLMNASLGFMIALGMLALAGIIINNGVVLIRQIDQERIANPGTGDEAIIIACRKRLRPILIATLTTAIGLLPLIVFRDALFFGMASVVAFGLLVGTFLTLGVIPVLYSMLVPDHGHPRDSNRPHPPASIGA